MSEKLPVRKMTSAAGIGALLVTGLYVSISTEKSRPAAEHIAPVDYPERRTGNYLMDLRIVELEVIASEIPSPEGKLNYLTDVGCNAVKDLKTGRWPGGNAGDEKLMQLYGAASYVYENVQDGVMLVGFENLLESEAAKKCPEFAFRQQPFEG